MNKALRLIALIFTLIGLLFVLIAGGMQFVYRQNTQNSIPVNGTIIGFSDSGYPRIAVTVDGETQIHTGHVKSSSQQFGDTVELLLDPNDLQIYDHVLPFIALIFAIVGGTQLIVGITIHVICKRKSRRIDRLRTYGRRVTVTVSDVRKN